MATQVIEDATKASSTTTTGKAITATSYQPARVVQTRRGRWETIPVGYIEKNAASSITTLETTLESPAVGKTSDEVITTTSSQPARETKPVEFIEKNASSITSPSTEISETALQSSTISKTSDKVITSYQPARVIQTRRGRWETIPVGYIEKKTPSITSPSTTTLEIALESPTISKTSEKVIASHQPAHETIPVEFVENDASSITSPSTETSETALQSPTISNTSHKATSTPSDEVISDNVITDCQPARIIQTPPGRWETIPVGYVEKKTSSMTGSSSTTTVLETTLESLTINKNSVQAISKSSHDAISMPSDKSTSNTSDKAITTHQPACVVQTRRGRWETLPVGHVEKPRTSKESSETSDKVINKPSEKAISKPCDDVISMISGDAISTTSNKAISKTTDKSITTYQPARVKKTRRGRWETLPVGFSEETLKWMNSAAHKYFPYNGPVKNRNVLAPRSFPVGPWGLSCWDKNGNKLRNDDDGTPYKPWTEFQTFDICFKKLPAELRIMIIEMSLEDRRVTLQLQNNVYEHNSGRSYPVKWIPLIQPPSALFVNKEFRNVALKKYDNFFGLDNWIYTSRPGEVFSSVTRPSAEPRIPFCWQTDTLVLDVPSINWFLRTVKQLQERDLNHVTKLAIRFDAFFSRRCIDEDTGEMDPWDFHRAISMFTNLIHLDLLVPDSDNLHYPYQKWKNEDFKHGNWVFTSLNDWKNLRPELGEDDVNPGWRVPFTVRTVQLLADGQPSYKGVEELFLVRRKMASAGVSFSDIKLWEKEVLKKPEPDNDDDDDDDDC